MTSFRLPLAMTAALLTLGAVSAHGAPHEHSAFITDYDLDKDGKVTAAEFKTVREQRFAAMDANKDGALTEAEYVGEYEGRLTAQLAASTESAERKEEQRVRQMRQAHVRFGVLDTSKDGRMSPAEFEASGLRAFAEQDGDGDGVITPGEKKKGE
jgi:Ca2+-binding EF-hand superfamily protein